MSKFNQAGVRPATGRGPVITSDTPITRTYEGAPGYSRDTKSELFLLAVSNMVQEGAFYDVAGGDMRFTRLVREVAVADGQWFANFVYWLRTEANMRSASLVAALEGVRARLQAQVTGDGVRNRALVDSVLQRGDEPAEALAYWTSHYGKAIPKPVKRGIADAMIRLGSEFNYVKWGTSESRGFTFADVLNLTHPGDKEGSRQELRGTWQSDLFGYAVARRYSDEVEVPDTLATLTRRQTLMSMPVNERRQILENTSRDLRVAGITWEALAGWLQGPMDRQAWEAIIPSMGYMALLRNLRNFDQAGVSDEVAAKVAAKLSDPDEVARSRQLPFRFLSAHRNAPSFRWSHALEKALDLSLQNIPELRGRTLVLVDQSGSMSWHVTKNTELTWKDTAALFGSAIAVRNVGRVDLVQFGTHSEPVRVQHGDPVLRVVQQFRDMGGTNIRSAVENRFAAHDRVIIITDEQSHEGRVDQNVPSTTPMYVFNLVGYTSGFLADGPNRMTLGGGLTDHAFRLVPLVESGRNGDWPWNVKK